MRGHKRRKGTFFKNEHQRFALADSKKPDYILPQQSTRTAALELETVNQSGISAVTTSA